jgi:inner membrane protein
LGLLFFQNPISLALALIGASLPDFDHDVKVNNVHILIITGLVIFGILYFLNLPYFIGILICLLAIIFYFSNHRGFTHSIFGIAILTALIFSIIIMGSFIILSISTGSVAISEKIAIGVMIIFLGILSLNKKLILPFILLFSIGLLFLQVFPVNYIVMIFSIFLGFLSHLILDSFTPSGLKVLKPFSSRKFHKDFGVTTVILLGILAIPQLIQVLNFILDYNLLYLFINFLKEPLALNYVGIELYGISSFIFL